METGPVKNAPVALQLWTVREEARRDFPGTVRQAAALGYAGVEHVHSLGYGGLPARQVRATGRPMINSAKIRECPVNTARPPRVSLTLNPGYRSSAASPEMIEPSWNPSLI